MSQTVLQIQPGRKGLKRQDLFTTVHETFWTDSCNYADVVLPADTALEHLDLNAPYGHYYFSLSQPAIKPLGEVNLIKTYLENLQIYGL